MARPWLLVLPVELLAEICASFCPHCTSDLDLLPDLDSPERYHQLAARQRDLASLSRTSKGIHPIATPFLYHVFATHKSTMHLHMRHQRTLHARPDLAAHVRRAVFDSYPDQDECNSVVNHLVARLGVSPPEGWIVPIKRFVTTKCGNRVESTREPLRHQFLVEMALNLTANLEHLSLYIPLVGYENYGENMPPSSNLPALRTLSLTFSHHARTGLPTVSLLLEKAPNLRLLRLDYCGMETYSRRQLQALSNLSVLWITRSSSFAKCLVSLFRGFKALQALVFHYYVISRHYIPRDTPQWLVSVALQHCCRTLRYLEIQWDSERVPPGDMVLSLQSFSALETLVMDATCVWFDRRRDEEQAVSPTALADLLPNSIQHVLLSRVSPGMGLDLAELAQRARHGAFPKLKEFWMSWVSSDDPALSETTIQALTADFSLAGISLRCFSSSESGLFSDPDALLRGDFSLHVPKWSLPLTHV